MRSGTGTPGCGDEFPGPGAHAVVRAVDVDGLAGQERPDHVHRLDQPVDAGCAGVEPQARGVILRFHVPRAEAQLEAASRNRRDGGGLACGVDGVAQVVVEHQRAGVQARRRARGGRGTRERRQRSDEMIGNRQHVEPGLLHGTREIAEVRATGQRGVQAEAERTGAMAFCGDGHISRS